MNKLYHLLLCSAVVLCALGAFASTAFAQETVEITEGREFYFGIPHCKKPTGEGARGVPIQLWVGSKVDNTVTVEAKALGFAQTHKVKAGTVKIISIPEGLMNTESEVKKPFGIHVTAVDPVTVTCYFSYKVSGEAFAVPSVESAGKKYFVASLWQDQTDEYKPGQILIVATKDNTKVTYTPTADTERVKAKKTGSVTLQKGETFLIRSKVQPAYNQDILTDLTGSYIEANKPIIVLSGHTKGAYPPFSATMLGTPANFMRNTLMDNMWAVEFLGKEYVIAPVQYTNRPYNGQDFGGEGDLIRFVASQDNTDLYVNRTDGTEPKLLKAGMKKGELYEVITFKNAAVYSASKPILAVQYGKSWRVSVVNPITDPSGDDESRISSKKEQVANPPRNGEGMMFALTPEAQWASHAIFRSPEGMNNFVNITFRTDHTDSLKFNKKYFRAVFGAKVQEIPGTPYSYVASINAAGEHMIEADPGSGAKFAAYVYGNFDATKDGFAYGYPVGVNYALPLPPDSIVVTDTMICGNVTGKVEIIHPGPEFAGLFDVRMDNAKSSNYTFMTKPNPIEVGSDKAEFGLTVIDPTKDAHGVVYIIERTGQQITRTYDYIAEKVVADPTSVKFGPLAIGAEECKQITLNNPTKADVTLKGLELKDGRAEFTIKNPTTFPLTIPAGASITIDVCGKAIAAGEVKDSVRALLTCYNPMIAELKIVAGQPKVTMNDLNFGKLPINIENGPRDVVIENISEGDVQVELYSVKYDDPHYRVVGLENDKFPIILPKRGDTYTFQVYYTPSVVGVQDIEVAEFTGNTTIEKLTSRWIGEGIDAGPYITGNDWMKKRINRGPYTFDKGTFGITGNESFIVERVEITGADASAFTVTGFDKYANKAYQPGTPFENLTYTFNPTEERAYEATITIHGKTELGGAVKHNFDQLLGIGIETHGKGEELNFGSHEVNTGEVAGTIHAYCIATENVPMLLTFNPADPIDGPDENNFRIDETQFDLTKTYEIAPGESLAIPVWFNPSIEKSSFSAYIDVTEDAPFEVVELKLLAASFSVGSPAVEITGDDFDPIYTWTRSDNPAPYFNSKAEYGKVTVRNTGTVDATITNWQLEGGDYINFEAPTVQPLPLLKGTETVIDRFVFIDPATMRDNYETTVDVTVTFNNGTTEVLQAKLTAEAKELPITVSIPTGYRVDAGARALLSYNIKNDLASEPLTNAKLTKFHVSVDYDKEVIRVEAANGNLKDAIELGNGTVLDAANGWEVHDIKLVPAGPGKEQLSIEFINKSETNPVVLSGTEEKPLFRFWVRSYIAVDQKTDLEPALQLIDRRFVTITEIKGDLELNPFCVDDKRAIKKRESFALASVAPNPVKDFTEISYSVAYDVPTRLVVVNSLGEEVAVLVDGVQEPGIYTVPFDVTNLSAGVYFYRITAGPYTETKTMNVVK